MEKMGKPFLDTSGDLLVLAKRALTESADSAVFDFIHKTEKLGKDQCNELFKKLWWTAHLQSMRHSQIIN